jgi:hypothetical protein
VRHRANPRFWRCYHALPAEVRQLADQAYQLLQQNPRHPSLQFKKMGRFWSARVGLHYRTLAVEHGPDIVWFWIGPHAEYDRIIRGRAH